MPWVILAGFVGATLGLIELLSATKPRLYLQTTAWVMARVSFDALAAAAAYPVLTKMVGEGSGVPSLAIAVTAGSSAPLILRSQVIQFGQQRLPFGPLYLYQRFRELADVKIRKKSATAESDYVWTKVVPAVSRRLELKALHERTRTYLERMGEPPELLELLDRTVQEDTDKRLKVAAIITMLMERKHDDQVRQLLKQARRVRKERQQRSRGSGGRKPSPR